MKKRIAIHAGDVTAFAELNDSLAAEAIWKALPIHARANTWGDEIYFSIPVKRGEEPNAAEVVRLGDLGYWPPGNAFCIFFGRTPASQGNEIRAASAVNLIGHTEGDAKIFKQVHGGMTITLERV